MEGVSVPDNYDSLVEEKKIRKLWEKNKTFEKIRDTLSKENDGKFHIYSAPVFPTGSPHSGHILNIVVKDALTRYAFQRHLEVETAFGWDCHGLAVEHEVEKKLGISSFNDVQAIGGASAFNEECRKFVERNIGEWESVFDRVGCWVDDSKQYRTMSAEYMESVWWVFKQLYDKGLVYRAKKVLPYSSGCRTHLSNFEAEQNLKEVTEVGWTISVNIVGSDEKLLIWTTTPAALVSSSAICVNPKTIYAKVKVTERTGQEAVYIISKNRVSSVFKDPSEYVVVDELIGKELQGLRYEPLFDGVSVNSDCRVITEDGVADDVGSGLVPLDDLLIESLRERGHVIGVEEVRYKKPHCWRSDTPLVNKQVETWFIRVEGMTEDLLKNVDGMSWFPDEDLKEKQMTNWLKDHCIDWAVGRTRSWGTPIPIWTSPSGDEIVCVGSIEELKRISGKKVINSMYKECLDWLVIPSRIPGNPPLRRVPEVLDCWFESAALPFAQGRHLSERFQADLAVEGVDQTRGWFYTTLVLSTALNKPSPFRNVFATGLVLGTDGIKMSKRKYNNHEAIHLMGKYGIDAVRLYLLSSSLLESQDLVLVESGVVEMVKTVIEPLYRIVRYSSSWLEESSYRHFGVYGAHEYFTDFGNTADIWVWNYSEKVLKDYHTEMAMNRLPNALKIVIEFIKQVEEWYVPNLKWTPKAFMNADKYRLFNLTYRSSLMLAPFAPHFAEYLYQTHRDFHHYHYRQESLLNYKFKPDDEAKIRPEVILRFSRVQRVVMLIQAMRTHHIVPPEYPISEVVVVHHNEGFRQDIELASDYVIDVANTKKLRASADLFEFGATLKAELEPSSEFYNDKSVASALHNLSGDEIGLFMRREHPSLLHIPPEDFRVSYQIKNEFDSLSAITEDDILVIMKMNKPLFFYEEGTLKELSRRIRLLKKKANYYDSDLTVIYYSTKNNYFENLLSKYREHLKTKEKCDLIYDELGVTKKVSESMEEVVNIKGLPISWYLHVKSD